MPAERTTMRQVREVLRLTTVGVGLNEIARRVGVAPSTVRLTLKRLARAGLSWPLPGEMTDSALETALFAAVLGASNFTYAEASWTQALADWIGAHTRAFAALGGVPKLLVPDNTKVAVIKACLYEPQVNRTYAEMAAHYDTAILPARPRRPRDKAKVEVAVLIIERWLLGRLRHRRFYSLAELNAAIGELLRQLNDERPIRRLGVTRRALFEELDRPNLNSLPGQPYCFAEWRVRRVGVDYHSLPQRRLG